MTDWLNTIVGEASAPYAAFILALIIVFILIAILFRIINLIRQGGFGGGYQNRLGIIEAATIEGKRRLVLIRRDNVEHLLLIGGENDLVIEQGIQRKAGESQVSAHPLAAPHRTTPQTLTPKSQPAALQAAPAKAATPPLMSAKPAPNAPHAPSPSLARPASPAVSVQNPLSPLAAQPTPNDSAKIKQEMNRLLDQIAGD